MLRFPGRRLRCISVRRLRVGPFLIYIASQRARVQHTQVGWRLDPLFTRQ